MTKDAAAFDFGENWERFASGAGREEVAAARAGLTALLPEESWRGAAVLDLGCGSGLHALAMATLGAHSVTAVDLSPRCVAVARATIDRLGGPYAARVLTRTASALDAATLEPPPRGFDVVYSWGVLHHTGSMWQAVDNALGAVRPGGHVVLALYNRHWSSRPWWWIKRLYVALPRFLQPVLSGLLWLPIVVAKTLVTRRNPFHQERGMRFWRDVVDWVGGFPYEYASDAEVRAHLAARGFRVVNAIPATVPTGCNQWAALREPASSP